MKVSAELRVVPYAKETSMGAEVNRIIDFLKGSDYIIETLDSGTNIEGELTDILHSIDEIHHAFFEEGKSRLLSYVRL